jgi:hypothetical protein
MENSLEQLNIRIVEEDEDDAVKAAADLKKWIESSDAELEEVKQVRKELKPDEAGGFFEPEVLIALLGTPAVVQLVKALNTWLSKKKELTIEVAGKDGKKVKISMKDGGKTEQEVVESVLSVLK